MGFIIKRKFMNDIARVRFRDAFSLLHKATEQQVSVIDDMNKFWKKRKYLSRNQIIYLDIIIGELKKVKR